MLTHIVMWKYHAEVDEKAGEQHVTRLRELAALIPEVQSLSVGQDVVRRSRCNDAKQKCGVEQYNSTG